MPKRKTAPQIEWERLRRSQPTLPSTPTYTEPILLSRRQFNALCQKFYRRGMERAAGVAEAAYPDPRDVTSDWYVGRNTAAARIRGFVAQGAKDE